ncbi:MAG: 50S ribosomal protein L35 [Elusimicrobiota bacterium]
MGKMKSHSGAKKRFKMTGTGKVKYKKNGTRHLLTGKSSKRMRHNRKLNVLGETETKRIHRLLPYA